MDGKYDFVDQMMAGQGMSSANRTLRLRLPFRKAVPPISTGIYTADRLADKIVGVRHNLPGSINLVHGVNDVGTPQSRSVSPAHSPFSTAS